MSEDDVIEQYDHEAERAVHRRERLAKMRKRKRRQLFFREHFRVILTGAVALIVLIAAMIIAGAVINRISASRDTAGETETETPTVEEVASEEDTEQTPEEEPEETDEYADSEYGPYADVYSKEKDIFFDGYDITIPADAPRPPEEEVLSTYALMVDAETGEVVASKGGDTRIYPASMTKILTLLVAAERVKDLDDTFRIDISITDYAYSRDCSAVGFSEGEVVTVRDLMYGTILPSGADAALALAEYVGGSHDRFVEMMNDKLAELGLSDTAHFTNCVGVYDDDHYCTMADMAMIMKAAVENDLARQVLNTHIYTTTSTAEHPGGIEISNWFLRRIEDKDTLGTVECAKTGFVKESGCCGASYEITDTGKYYICVTADAWSSWRCIYDHVAMYNRYTK